MQVRVSGAVIGLGETGRPLYEILWERYQDTVGMDIGSSRAPVFADILHICIPYTERFLEIVREYDRELQPTTIVVHSTVPIGTTAQIEKAVHSPILGDHTNMQESILAFDKWIGGPNAARVADYFRAAGIKCRVVDRPEITEALKLMCLAKYGMSIAFAAYQKKLCDRLDIPFGYVLEWDMNYNAHVNECTQRPILLFPSPEGIGGHCVIPGTRLLQEYMPNDILEEILRCTPGKKYTAWQPCNIYPSARIGLEASIGAFSEIGPNVVIGDRVRIGAMTFIPEGVTIEEDAWIGPRVTFCNDKYPPSHRSEWKPTLIKKGAVIGASCTILPGVTIGEGARVGAGTVITRDVPPGELWIGVAGRNKWATLETCGAPHA